MNIEEYAKKAPQYYDVKIPKLLRKYLCSNSFNTILDCGCGDGALLYALYNEGFLKNKVVYAIDMSKRRISLVKKIDKNLRAFVDNAESLRTIQSNSIDFFISTQVIEHVNDKKMVASIDKVTRKNSVIYISTVFKKKWGWYFYRNKGKWVLDPTHIKEYKRDSDLLDLFKERSFRLLENKKSQLFFSLGGFVLPRIGIKSRNIKKNKFFVILRKIKAPILGYYNWEIVLRKE